MPFLEATRTDKRALSKSSASASASSSDPCSGKHPDKSLCEKPVSNNALEIGVGVAVPCAVILLVLGWFVVRNYRREKKEALDHDPDFDENGEATVLPDLPAFSKEDPFNVPSTYAKGGFPSLYTSNSDAASHISTTTSHEQGKFVDGFVLPYMNQIGSKASLDEFARHSSDLRTFHKKRGSNFTNSGVNVAGTRVSQRSGLHSSSTSPVKARARNQDYELADISSHSDLTHMYNTTKETYGDGTTSKSSSSNDQFAVEYENESSPAINSTLPSTTKDYGRKDYSHNYNESESDLESVSDDDDDEPQQRVIPKFDVQSPFENEQFEDSLQEQEPQSSKAVQSSGSPVKTRAESQPSQRSRQEHDEADTSRATTEEQAEQLARMKSVYNVYFDRSNSVSSRANEAEPRQFTADESQPLPDISNMKNVKNLTVDTDTSLRKSTASSVYDTGHQDPAAGSYRHPDDSYYGDDQHQQDESYYGEPNGYQQQYNQTSQYYNESSQQRQQFYQQPAPQSPQILEPLKSLPSASDIRNSTIETFTQYQPRAKVSSPSLKHGFDSESVTSPYMQSQQSFAPNNGSSEYFGELPPMIRSNPGTNGSGSKPSASQLSRTSVVMLNPVNEITTSRKFKPAGSLPSGMNNGMQGGEFVNGEDLIPGNRKSAVRRMMNTNF